MGRKDWSRPERRRQTGNAREARQAGTGNRLLSAAPHQRTSAGKRKDFGQARETSLWSNSRERCASSECRCDNANLLEPRPQPAALVFGGVQSKYADAAAAPVARPLEATRRRSRGEVSSANLPLVELSTAKTRS